MEPIPIEKLFPGASITVEGEPVNTKSGLINKYTAEKGMAVESINTVREQIARLQQEERRLIEVNLRIDGCLHALSELEDESKPVADIVPLPVKEKAEEE